MKKTALSLAVACAFGASSALANGYQFEVDAGYDRTKISGFSGDAVHATGRYYLDAVDNSQGPLGEAAFLNKATFLEAGYGYLFEDQDGDVFSVGGEYVSAGQGFILGASYAWLDDGSYDEEAFSVTVGKYLTDTTTVRLSYAEVDFDDLWDSEALAASVRHLTGDLGNGMQLAVEGTLARLENDYGRLGTDKATLMDVSSDLYLTREFSVGAGYQYVNGDSALDADGFNVRARYFILPQLAVNAQYGQFNPDLGWREKSWGVGVTARF